MNAKVKEILQKIDKFVTRRFLLAVLLTVILGSFLPLWIAAVVTLVAGVSKEIYDKLSGNGAAEIQDILSDVIAIAVACLVVLLYNL